MDEESERQKLLSFGLTEDVIQIVIEKKRILEKQKSCVIADQTPIPEQIPESIQIDIIPAPDPEPLVEIKQEQHIVDDGRNPSSGTEIKQEHIFYAGMPIWKRRLSQRNNK